MKHRDILAASGVALVAATLFSLPALDRLDGLSIDLLFWLRHQAFGARHAATDSPTVVIAIDAFGNAYITGYTESKRDFPTVDPFQPDFGGGADAFVTKLNPAGDALVYSSYLGGGKGDSGQGIALDAQGRVYVAGNTFSADFPTVDPYQAFLAGYNNLFVAKVSDAVAPSTLEESDDGGGKGKPCNPKKEACS